MARIVIIGAGLTGLSAAYHLEQKGFFDYVLLEQHHTPGGLCGSIAQDGFTFDFTGHLLHINDHYCRQFIDTVIGFDFFNTIQRKSYIYSHHCYTAYPYQVNLHGLPHEVIIECITEFAERAQHKKNKSFKDWVLSQFGAGFAKHFFIPYQEKIFSYPIDRITASWTSRFVPPTTLHAILQGTLQEPINTIGYNSHFYYPKNGGILSWVLKIADKLKNPILCNHSATAIDTNTKTIHIANGKTESYDLLINTMPLDTLLTKLIEKPRMDCKKAAKKLLCNRVFNFNLGINRPNISDKHWIYYPERIYPFYRIGFPHNLSTLMTPPGCSSLSGEIAYLNNPIHNTDTYQQARTHIKQLFDVHESEIITEKIITINHAYVIFDFWREKNLPRLLNQLSQEHIYSVGRYGAWKYASMQEAILDGKQIADQVTIIPARNIHQIPTVITPPTKEIECLEK